MIVFNPVRVRPRKRFNHTLWLRWYGVVSIIVIILLGGFG